MPDLHCRHCGTECTGGTDLGDGPNLHTDMAFAFWRDDHCPACAEAGRIAELLRAEADAIEVPEGLTTRIRESEAIYLIKKTWNYAALVALGDPK